MALTVPLQAADPDADPLLWEASNLPTGAVLTSNADGTAQIDWTPAFGQEGAYSR